MARTDRTQIIPPAPLMNGEPDEYEGDDLTPDEVAQAEVGDLISIQGPQFDSVSWSIWRHRTRQEMASESNPEAMEWVASRHGQVHGADLIEAIGGGTFNFRGYVPRSDGRGVRLKYNRTIAIAGPRKDFSAAPAPAPSPSQTVATATDPMLVTLLARMDDRLSRLERDQTQARPATSLKELAETMVMLDQMRRPSAAGSPDPLETAKGFMDAVRQGIELGQAREPLPPDVERGTDWVKIMDTAAPLLERIFSGVASRRVVMKPPPQRPTESRAEVVNDATPAPPAGQTVPPPVVEDPETQAAQARMMTVIDSLARAITHHTEPEDFAGTVADILTDDELGQILAGPPDLVISELTSLSHRYPILGTDAAKAYIGAVLNELRKPMEDDA